MKHFPCGISALFSSLPVVALRGGSAGAQAVPGRADVHEHVTMHEALHPLFPGSPESGTLAAARRWAMRCTSFTRWRAGHGHPARRLPPGYRLEEP